MPETVLVALIAAGGALLTTALTAALGAVISRLSRVDGRLKALEHRDRLSWLYIRRLIDHAYRYTSVPLPEPPEGWLEEPE